MYIMHYSQLTTHSWMYYTVKWCGVGWSLPPHYIIICPKLLCIRIPILIRGRSHFLSMAFFFFVCFILCIFFTHTHINEPRTHINVLTNSLTWIKFSHKYSLTIRLHLDGVSAYVSLIFPLSAFFLQKNRWSLWNWFCVSLFFFLFIYWECETVWIEFTERRPYSSGCTCFWLQFLMGCVVVRTCIWAYCRRDSHIFKRVIQYLTSVHFLWIWFNELTNNINGW